MIGRNHLSPHLGRVLPGLLQILGEGDNGEGVQGFLRAGLVSAARQGYGESMEWFGIHRQDVYGKGVVSSQFDKLASQPGGERFSGLHIHEIRDVHVITSEDQIGFVNASLNRSTLQRPASEAVGLQGVGNPLNPWS